MVGLGAGETPCGCLSVEYTPGSGDDRPHAAGLRALRVGGVRRGRQTRTRPRLGVPAVWRIGSRFPLSREGCDARRAASLPVVRRAEIRPPVSRDRLRVDGDAPPGLEAGDPPGRYWCGCCGGTYEVEHADSGRTWTTSSGYGGAKSALERSGSRLSRQPRSPPRTTANGCVRGTLIRLSGPVVAMGILDLMLGSSGPGEQGVEGSRTHSRRRPTSSSTPSPSDARNSRRSRRYSRPRPTHRRSRRTSTRSRRLSIRYSKTTTSTRRNSPTNDDDRVAWPNR